MHLVYTLILSGKCVCVVVLLAFCSHSMASSYTNGINSSAWRAESSVFDCYLKQDIPYYGDAIFHIQAGGKSHFYLKSKTSRLKSGDASIVALTPVWSEHQKYEDLGAVKVKQGLKPVWVGSQRAEQMMSRLNNGFEIELKRAVWYDTRESVRLALSSIGFRKEYQQYLNCLGGLLPANFHQLERSALLFPAGVLDPNEDLSRANKRKLDNILMLIKHDKTIRHFYIDGHTDSEGDRVDNLELSKIRAEMVSQYLERRGIPKSWFTVRWHGERYPIKTNNSSAGRAKNRRVTVRLERIEEIEVLPLADAK